MELTQEYLKSVLNYCPESGVFTWRVKTCHKVTVGKVAGNINSRIGYRYIGIDGKAYLAHRLAWLYMTGKWPKDEIDHTNLNRSDNRITNLREANRSQNNSNTPVQKNNKSGLKGVSPVKDSKKRPWVAQITVAGKQTNLGRFETKELAHAAYCKAAEKHKGKYARY